MVWYGRARPDLTLLRSLLPPAARTGQVRDALYHSGTRVTVGDVAVIQVPAHTQQKQMKSNGLPFSVLSCLSMD